MRSIWIILILPILAVIFYVNSTSAVPVEEWNMTTIRNMGKINDIEQADDGGYIVASDYSIAKIDPSGHKYWVRELIKPILPTSGHAEISQIAKTGDGGYIFGGSRVFLTNLSISKQIRFIIKTDSEGFFKALSIKGIKKAAVFPVPVLAMPTMSEPCKTCGIARS